MNLSDSFADVTFCDLSQGIAGPHATMLFAQFGANIIKVEPPGGDWGRALGDQYGDHCIHSWYYNLGKRSVTLDLKGEASREKLRTLIEASDVFVESFRPGVAKRLGFSYDAVRSLRPDIIYASVSGFGQTGPNSRRGTVDALMQGFSGMMVMNRTPDGVPRRQNMVAVDVVTGLYLHVAIAAALAHRRASGEGTYLDISLMQAAAAFQGAKIAEYAVSSGEGKLFYAPVGLLPTIDGAVSVSCRLQDHFVALCERLKLQHVADERRFKNAQERVENNAELMTILGKASAEYSTDVLLRELHAAGVFAEKVQSYGDWLSDSHVDAANAFHWVEVEGIGRLPLAHVPGLGTHRESSPRIGEHTSEVLLQGIEAATR
ncbi:CaiB/BaiF CoA transferase family protein [Cupriavidus taiwanensis]|uniref:CaiB/BaiF CoA transferase family protein n=1 Tax=Cupriavidus taiwanensis TaxID=164546 RepID=UPI0039C279F4